jgi:DNA-binding NtrC family response regulator
MEVRSILYEILSDLGYRITTILKDKELLETLKTERPDYIILDPTIPEVPIEILRNKINAIDENIKVIVLENSRSVPQIVQDILKILREKDNFLSTPRENKGMHLEANVLVVDDEKECAELIKNYLSRKGYNVDTASSGEEAIFKVKIHKPDIVLLDIRMSGIDGIIVLKTIKDIDKSIIVIMTSVMKDDDVMKEAVELGADGYLVKPFGLLKLEETILKKAIQKCLK